MRSAFVRMFDKETYRILAAIPYTAAQSAFLPEKRKLGWVQLNRLMIKANRFTTSGSIRQKV